MPDGKAGQHDAVDRLVEHGGELCEHHAVQAVGVGERAALRAEQQLAGRDRVVGLDGGPAEFGQPRPDRNMLAGRLVEEPEHGLGDHRPGFVGHLRTSFGRPSRWSAMMPRWISAVPPMIIAAREYHHSARAVSSSLACELPSPAIMRSRCTSKIKS